MNLKSIPIFKKGPIFPGLVGERRQGTNKKKANPIWMAVLF